MPTTLEPTAPPRAAPRWAVALAFVSHVVITFAVFPPREVWRDAPFLADDYSARFRYALTRGQLLERGQLEGYDPAFLAGFPECGHLLAGGHAWTVGIAALGPVLGEARAFNLVTVLLVLSTLPLVAVSGWALELGAAASWVPLIALPVVWTGVPFAFPMTGSPIWLAGSALALATAALYRRFLAGGRARDGVLAALGAAAVGTVHELAAALVIVHALPVLVVTRLRPPARVLGGTLAIVAFAVLANLHWLIPFVARHDVALGYGGGTDGVLDWRFTAFALVYPHGLPVLVALYGFAVVGCARCCARRNAAPGSPGSWRRSRSCRSGSRSPAMRFAPPPGPSPIASWCRRPSGWCCRRRSGSVRAAAAGWPRCGGAGRGPAPRSRSASACGARSVRRCRCARGSAARRAGWSRCCARGWIRRTGCCSRTRRGRTPSATGWRT
ncbi:MAG: hypothetical protein IPK07_08875 [Deltaproteobacteria bacterium]|nr:hypothetical protein [Deltaproteobacteria bacterium]